MKKRSIGTAVLISAVSVSSTAFAGIDAGNASAPSRRLSRNASASGYTMGAEASRVRHSSASGYMLGAEASRVRHSSASGYMLGAEASRVRHTSGASAQKSSKASSKKAASKLALDLNKK